VIERGPELGAIERLSDLAIVRMLAQDLRVFDDGPVVFLKLFGGFSGLGRSRCGAARQGKRQPQNRE
jgi:hypothetical protein